jgi:hypothetical protein
MRRWALADLANGNAAAAAAAPAATRLRREIPPEGLLLLDFLDSIAIYSFRTYTHGCRDTSIKQPADGVDIVRDFTLPDRLPGNS